MLLEFSKWNTILESKLRNAELPPEIWNKWLWYTDPQEAPSADLELNQCQLLGLLICRFRSIKFDNNHGQVPFANRQLQIIDKNICDMTLRELRDTLSNVTLQFASVVQKQENTQSTFQFLDMCFHRFGEFCWASWLEDAPSNPIADDVSSIECFQISENVKHQRITFSCMRNMLNTFLVLYRLVSWQTQSAPCAIQNESTQTTEEVMIEKHHIQASLDIFYKLAMFYDLMPAGRLNYMHNFSGLYNCISQPTYFHNPDYERRVQLPLAEVQTGKHDIHTLPALMQMYPEIVLLYEDDDIQQKMKAARAKLIYKPTSPYMWAWIVTAAKRIYLMRWDSKDGSHQVFYFSNNPNIIALVVQYFLPWHAKHSQILAAAASVSQKSILNADTSRGHKNQNQIMTYFKMYYSQNSK